MHPPEVIYLQWYGDQPTTRFDDDDTEIPIPEEELEEPPDSIDVCWCTERIFEADIPYIRARYDVARELQSLRARIRELELDQEWINDVGRPEHPDAARRDRGGGVDERNRRASIPDYAEQRPHMGWHEPS